MAFDTRDERRAMVDLLGCPVPQALPDAAAGFTSKVAAMMLYMFPVDGLSGAEPVVTAAGSSQQPIPRLRMLDIVRW